MQSDSFADAAPGSPRTPDPRIRSTSWNSPEGFLSGEVAPTAPEAVTPLSELRRHHVSGPEPRAEPIVAAELAFEDAGPADLARKSAAIGTEMHPAEIGRQAETFPNVVQPRRVFGSIAEVFRGIRATVTNAAVCRDRRGRACKTEAYHAACATKPLSLPEQAVKHPSGTRAVTKWSTRDVW